MNLNIPDTRQQVLAERLARGQQIVASDVAGEFGVSLDTIRRDILALEADGHAQRVRGGAVPIARPAPPLHMRLAKGGGIDPGLTALAVAQIADASTLLLDGGTTTLSLISKLPPRDGRLIMTPSPWIAIACQECGIPVFVLGGKLSTSGGITTGEFAREKISAVAADVAVLGACGLDCEFGLSSDDDAEARMKQAMQAAAARTIVVTDHEKLGRRARHHTLSLAQIDLLVTDASPAQVAPLAQAGLQFVLARHGSGAS